MNRRCRSGLTLVEVMISFIIMALAILPVLMVLMRDTRGITTSWVGLQHAVAARDLMEQIRRCKWDANSLPDAVIPVTGASNPLGQEIPDDFDDVDDWNNYADTLTIPWQPQAALVFRRSVNVDYVDVLADGTTTTATVIPSNYKRITITVQHEGRPDFVLVGIMANLVK